jgi:hypothetical protein
MEENKLLLAELYAAYFNRAPDAEGLRYWLNELEEGSMQDKLLDMHLAIDQSFALR